MTIYCYQIPVLCFFASLEFLAFQYAKCFNLKECMQLKTTLMFYISDKSLLLRCYGCRIWSLIWIIHTNYVYKHLHWNKNGGIPYCNVLLLSMLCWLLSLPTNGIHIYLISSSIQQFTNQMHPAFHSTFQPALRSIPLSCVPFHFHKTIKTNRNTGNLKKSIEKQNEKEMETSKNNRHSYLLDSTREEKEHEEEINDNSVPMFSQQLIYFVATDAFIEVDIELDKDPNLGEKCNFHRLEDTCGVEHMGLRVLRLDLHYGLNCGKDDIFRFLLIVESLLVSRVPDGFKGSHDHNPKDLPVFVQHWDFIDPVPNFFQELEVWDRNLPPQSKSRPYELRLFAFKKSMQNRLVFFITHWAKGTRRSSTKLLENATNRKSTSDKSPQKNVYLFWRPFVPPVDCVDMARPSLHD
ncbi:hypothetical protein LXL04_009426 [Taraxacum kok-saghyz]